MKIVGTISNKRILFLQGPMGRFFKQLATFMQEHGAEIHTIGFNFGDQFFSKRDSYTAFKGTQSEWHTFISHFLKTHRIQIIFLFGNCRFYHRIATEVARAHGIKVLAFEEGYIRPHYVTLEPYGVNGDSNIPLNPDFYHDRSIEPAPSPKHSNNSYMSMALQAMLYYFLNQAFSKSYPHYRHHRDQSVLKEFCYGCRNLFRKILYKSHERNIPALLSGKLKKKFYFVPLQTRTDHQLLVYSDYSSIEDFIQEVVHSFALNSPEESYLVIKHHPMERGMSTYTKYIKSLASDCGIANRVLVTYDTHLPTSLKHAIGTITINSTVGVSSLFHATPTITLGKAFYDIEGLTCKGMQLDDFWTKHVAPERKLFIKFRDYVINETQLNGGFFGNFPDFAPSITEIEEAAEAKSANLEGVANL